MEVIMKNNAIKKVLSLLLVICMMASFAGCIPGEEDPTEPSTTVPTDGTDLRHIGMPAAVWC